jgi:hypothetical protein
MTRDPCHLSVDAEHPPWVAHADVSRSAMIQPKPLLYARAGSPRCGRRADRHRGRVAILPGGTLQWAGRLSSTNEPVTFTFTLVKGHGHLLGERYFHETGSVSIVTMEKVPPSSSLPDSVFLAPLTRLPEAGTLTRLSEASSLAEDTLKSREMA